MYNQIDANKRKSAFIMIMFAAFAGLIAYAGGYYLGGESFAPFAIFAALVYVVVSYYSGSRMALSLNGAKEVNKKQEPRLYRIVENLAITEGMPMPKVYVMEDSALNAFATGRDPNHAVVCATMGIMDSLSDAELQGVMAHELGHVKNYDIRVSLVAFAMASLIGIIADMVIRMQIFGGGNNKDDNSNASPVFMVISIIAIILAPIVAALVQMAISRRREYLADATGALTTRYPEGLASALEKIGQSGGQLKNQNSSTAHLFFANPLKKKSLASLFSTHPPLEERIKRLREMGDSL